MNPIVVEEVIHHDEDRLLLKFDKDQALIDLVREIPGCKWSKTHNAWHVPNNTESKVNLVRLTSQGQVIRWANQVKVSSKRIAKSDVPSTDVIDEVIAFSRYLTQRRYSDNTIRVYTLGVKVFLQFTGKPVEEITNKDIERFNHDYIVLHKYSSAFQNQMTSAIKLFFETIHSTKINIQAIERPRREHKLPNVLSKQEVKKILTSSTNIKHRMMLSLIYACGLRRRELINLKPNDVDSKRGLLIVRMSKGNKDRIVPISEKTVEMLRDYYKMYKPKNWLFEGQIKGEQYSPTSLQEILKFAVKKAGVNKPVTLHWLRHSYATHLLESGTDLRYIQELLGHKSSRTTEIYTHVTTKSIQKIKSPFDDL